MLQPICSASLSFVGIGPAKCRKITEYMNNYCCNFDMLNGFADVIVNKTNVVFTTH